MEESALNRQTAPQPRGIAVRLWAAARTEFSLRGYHGARVQGIARRAGCNVALLYRHWSSKKALYLDILKAVWLDKSSAIIRQLEKGGGAPAVVSAYLDTLLSDPEGAQVLVREYLDGGSFLSQLIASEAGLVEPVRRTMEALESGNGTRLRPNIDPTLASLAIGGLAALLASAQETARPFLDREISIDEWRYHISELLLHGLLRSEESATLGEHLSSSESHP